MATISFARSGLLDSEKYKNALAGNLASSIVEASYLVIAGGGGGGRGASLFGGGGGGAGGYQIAFAGETSGGPAALTTLQPFRLNVGTTYSVTIGASGAELSNGFPSTFHTVTSTGGGAGKNASAILYGNNGGSGGAAGGANRSGLLCLVGGTAVVNQGHTAGLANGSGGPGGGGAGNVGNNAPGDGGGGGGVGRASTITGSAVTRSKGGNGGNRGGGAGTSGGGANTGGGGGGGGQNVNGSTAAGSGVVILRYQAAFNITIGAGLAGTTTSVGADKVTTITAGTGTVSWAVA